MRSSGEPAAGLRAPERELGDAPDDAMAAGTGILQPVAGTGRRTARTGEHLMLRSRGGAALAVRCFGFFFTEPERKRNGATETPGPQELCDWITGPTDSHGSSEQHTPRLGLRTPGTPILLPGRTNWIWTQ